MSYSKVDVKRRRKETSSYEELLDQPKNDLVNRILQLEAHNKQLKSILSKHNNPEPTTNEERKRKRPFDFSRFPKQHIAIKLLYMGWNYQGFATIEESASTIEHHLFSALEKSCLIESRQSAAYSRCGRTDKTVSATDQVISLTVRAANDGQSPLEYCKILNRLLPKDIRTIAWKPVADSFNARFDCKRRTYKYYFPRGDLDLKAMEKAAQYLVGNHDFRNLCKMDVANGVVAFERTIERADICTLSSSPTLKCQGYDMCEFILSSKGFLWHQVRSIMGVLLLVGKGLEQPEIISDLLDVTNFPRKPQYPMAVGEPLNLFHCEFDLDDDWVVDQHSLMEVIRTLQQEWALHSVKETMVGQMLKGLEHLCDGSQQANLQTSGLLQGTKSKVYIPLVNRPTCQSLEARIAHYVEKKRISMSTEEPS